MIEEQPQPTTDVLGGLGQRAKVRPEAAFPPAFLTTAVLLAAIGALALIFGDDGSRTTTIVAGLGLLVGGYALAHFGPEILSGGGIGMILAGVPIALSGILLTDDAGTGSLYALLIVSALIFAGLYFFVPATKGHTPLIGFAALFFWFFVVAVAADDELGISSDVDEFSDAFTSTATAASWASLLVGAAYLGLTMWLDKREYRGLGTAFAAVGGVAFLIGAAGVIGDLGSGEGTVTALLFVAAALVLGFVGHIGRRRFTTWTGAVGFFLGCAALASSLTDNNRGVGGILLILGLITVAAIYFVANDPDGLAGARAKLTAGTANAAGAGTAGSSGAVTPEAHLGGATPYQAGWFPDPLGRFEQRYHDGHSWTANVANSGQQYTDPSGAS